MDDILGGGGAEQSAPTPYYDRNADISAYSAKVARPPNMKEKLELAVVQAEAKLKDAKEARDILAKNPDLERLLDILQRNHF